MSAQIGTTAAGVLTQAERDAMTPRQVLEELKQGNQRFRAGSMAARDYAAQRRARAPAEIIFDVGIGDMFSARIAGNIVNDDLIGSLEFACAAAGARLVLLYGHTACGAIEGAIDGVELGHLTGLLARITPAIAATTFAGEKSIF
ncbi:MAG TPA: carbonic anhydrase [Vicinamibacterales bacterium]|nr:carbonic anhydrase [Vicinamibacterales bacterium]